MLMSAPSAALYLPAGTEIPIPSLTFSVHKKTLPSAGRVPGTLS